MKIFCSKRFNIVFPLLFVLGCAATSKDEKKSFNQIVGYDYCKNDQSILWEISGNGLKQPSFLYGTIHLQDKRVFSYSKEVMAIFDTCSAYAMELNMDEIDAKEMMKSFRLEKPLYEMIPGHKFKLLDSLLKLRTGGGIGMYVNFKPFFIAGELVKAYEDQDMPFPLDMDFFQKAKKKKKKVIGIEKLEEQLAAVDSMTLEDQADMIIDGLKDWDKSKKLYNDMTRTYLKQDIKEMMLMMKDTTLPKAFETSLIIDRNKVMAERIDKIVNDQPTFNAVGAGHLHGDEGVIALLRNKGYTLKPVKFKFKKK